MFNFEVIKDIKYNINSELIIPEDSECFSTIDFEENDKLGIFVRSLYPDKCIYEK